MDEAARQERWGRVIALGWTVAYIGLIVLVSLKPGRFDTDPAHVARKWAAFRHSMEIGLGQVRGLHSLRDLATNFLLYVPLGVLLPWVLAPRRALLAAGAVVGTLISLGCEGAQVYTNRFPSVWDTALNSAGFLAAYVVVTLAILRRDLSAAIFLGRTGRQSRETIAAGLRLIYTPLFWLVSLMPLNITVQSARVWGKLRGEVAGAGAVWLDPLTPWSLARLQGIALEAALLVPFGFLTALARPALGRRVYVHAAILGLLVAASVEAAQLLVPARSVDVLQLFAGALGAVIGAALARAWERAESSDEAGRPPSDDGTRAFALRDGLLVAIVLYAFALMLEAWRPFDFTPTARDAVVRLIKETEWIPLHHYMTGPRSLVIFRDVGREAGLYVPLGMLLQAYLSRVTLPRFLPPRLWTAMGVVLVVGGTLELGQAMVVTRLPGTTDIMSHLIGGLAGYLILSALRPRRVRASE